MEEILFNFISIDKMLPTVLSSLLLLIVAVTACPQVFEDYFDCEFINSINHSINQPAPGRKQKSGMSPKL